MPTNENISPIERGLALALNFAFKQGAACDANLMLHITPDRGNMIKTVLLSKSAKKQLLKVPGFIRDKLLSWVMAVEKNGLEVVRRIPGFHDEPLQGELKGLRSIRLSRSYRAYYRIVRGQVESIFVEGVDKHEY